VYCVLCTVYFTVYCLLFTVYCLLFTCSLVHWSSVVSAPFLGSLVPWFLCSLSSVLCPSSFADIHVYAQEAAKQRKLIYQLEKERERLGSDAAEVRIMFSFFFFSKVAGKKKEIKSKICDSHLSVSFSLFLFLLVLLFAPYYAQHRWKCGTKKSARK
jgi:hypothetical protein